MATSKIIEDMCNEAKIHGSIIVLKEMKLSDDQIVTFLESMYDFLSKEEAEKFVKDFED